MRYNDLIVVGSGIAGLISAIVASRGGLKVAVLSHGSGVLSIGGGSVDFLGYDNGERIKDNPFNHLKSLPATHPYNLVGEAFIKDSFNEFIDIVKEGGIELTSDSRGINKIIATIIGTVKPTYLTTKSADIGKLITAKKVAVVTVDYLKDCKPKLIINGFKEFKKLSDKIYDEVVFQSPFGKTYRAINCLDIARFVDTAEGSSWLISELEKIKKNDYEVIVLPPILGVFNHNKILDMMEAKGLNTIEMNSIPPGVGGVRLREALYKVARGLGVAFIENCFISDSVVEKGRCVKLLANDNNIAKGLTSEFVANNFIIATGGVLGGGIDTDIGGVFEKIFKLNIDCPKAVEDRSVRDFFGDHKFASIGVNVNKRMQAIDERDHAIFSNVFFAGKILAGYDFAKEKSGYGVAIVSARKSAIEVINSHLAEGNKYE